MTEEIYPMPSFPLLIVSDLEASANFYQHVLGFKHIFTVPGPGGQPALVHLRWVKYADLLITKAQNGTELSEPRGVGISLNFGMLNGLMGISMRLQRRLEQEGRMNVSGPIHQPWNVREVTILDPDGYKLVFTVPLDINLEFDKMLEQTGSSKQAE